MPLHSTKRPAPVALMCPADCLQQLALEMDDRALAPAVGKFLVIGAVDQVKHDRARTKVERHTLSNVQAWMARQLELVKAPCLYTVHADRCARAVPPH